MVQAVCLPSWEKTLVIPIFFPIIPFIVRGLWPRVGCEGQFADEANFNPRLLPTFSLVFSQSEKRKYR
jgi:hypothetical protein